MSMRLTRQEPPQGPRCRPTGLGRPLLLWASLALLCVCALSAFPVHTARAGEDPVEGPGAALARLEQAYRASLARHDERAYTEQRRVLFAIADLDTAAAQMALRALLTTHGQGGDRVRTINLLRARARRARPADLDEIIQFIERAQDPLLLEALAQVLAEIKRDATRQHLRLRVLRRATPAILAQVIPAIGMLGDPDAKLALLPYLRSKHLRVRIEAIGALGLLKDATALGLLAPFANSTAEPDWRVRRAVVRTLGMIGQRAPSPVAHRALDILLRSLAREENERVTEMIAQGLGMLGLPGAVEPLIAGLAQHQKQNLRLADAFASALHRISGKPLGLDVDLWRSWWEVMKQQSFERIEQEGGGGTAAGVRYYGFPVRSSKVLFVLDISRSMGWNERLVTAQKELTRTISHLPVNTKFGILTYSDQVHVWRRGLQFAKPANVRGALAFIKKQKPDNGTNSFGALRAAFDHADVDTIFFLTDGHPTTGALIDPDLILASVGNWNRHRHVRLHTIALVRGAPPPAYAGREDAATATAFMKRLAAKNQGRFQAIR